MDDERIQVPPGLTTDGLIGWRYLARMIDSVLVGLLAVVASLLLRLGLPEIMVIPAALLAAFVGYGGLLESSAWQATLGKKMLGMRVFTIAGQRLSFPRAVARSIAKDGPFVVLAFLPFAQWLQLAWLGLHVFVVHQSPVYQAIHDRVVGTLVAANEETTRLNLSMLS